MELSTEVLMDMHRRMVRIRLFEEAALAVGCGVDAAPVVAPGISVVVVDINIEAKIEFGIHSERAN